MRKKRKWVKIKLLRKNRHSNSENVDWKKIYNFFYKSNPRIGISPPFTNAQRIELNTN